MNILAEIASLDARLYLLARLRREAEAGGKPDVVDDLDKQWMETDLKRQGLRAKLTIEEDLLYERMSSPVARNDRKSDLGRNA